jgi:hypothetical protein
MYLYLNEEITHCGGEHLYDKYHLINLGSLPKKDPARKKARKSLDALAEFWRYSCLLEESEISDWDPDSRWDYEEGQWVETIIVTEEERREQWKKSGGWW